MLEVGVPGRVMICPEVAIFDRPQLSAVVSVTMLANARNASYDFQQMLDLWLNSIEYDHLESEFTKGIAI
jgi:hypothetical protein